MQEERKKFTVQIAVVWEFTLHHLPPSLREGAKGGFATKQPHKLLFVTLTEKRSRTGWYGTF